MLHYLLQNMKKNKSNYVLIYLVLMISTVLMVFTFKVIYSLDNKITNELVDFVLKKDLQDMRTIMQLCVAILTSFSLFIIYNTYSIVIQSRIEEFRLIYKIGTSPNRIKRMLYLESVSIGLISTIVGIVLGIISSWIFSNIYGDITIIAIPGYVYGCIIVGIILSLLLIVRKNYKKTNYSDEFIITKSNRLSNKKQKRLFIQLILGCIMLILSLLDFGKNVATAELSALSINLLLAFIGIFILFDGFFLLVLKVSRWVAMKSNFVGLQLSVEQLLFDFSKNKRLVSTLAAAVMLLVGMFGFFHSTKEAVVNQVQQTYHFDYLLTINGFSAKSETELKTYLDKLENPKGEYYTTLTMELTNSNNKKIILTGIDEKFGDIQTIITDNQDDIKPLTGYDKGLETLFPSQMAESEGWTIGDKLQYSLNNQQNIDMEISQLYKPLDLTQVFTSKEILKEKVFQNSEAFNSVYFSGYSYSQVKDVVDFLGISNYSVLDIDDLKDKYKDQAIKGTEMIEAFLYVLLVFAGAIVLNVFVLSFNYRKKIYSMLLIIGVKKRLIVCSMLIECTLIYFVGALLGWQLGRQFAIGGIEMMKELMVFTPNLHLPYPLLISSVGTCYIAVLIGVIAISIKLLSPSKDKMSEKRL